MFRGTLENFIGTILPCFFFMLAVLHSCNCMWVVPGQVRPIWLDLKGSTMAGEPWRDREETGRCPSTTGGFGKKTGIGVRNCDVSPRKKMENSRANMADMALYEIACPVRPVFHGIPVSLDEALCSKNSPFFQGWVVNLYGTISRGMIDDLPFTSDLFVLVPWFRFIAMTCFPLAISNLNYL